MSICLLIMVKDEESNILMSINTCKGYIDGVIIVDTGSTDNTLKIATKMQKKSRIPFHIHNIIFTDFARTRNECLAIAGDYKFNYLLLMDGGDEFKTELTPARFKLTLEGIHEKYKYFVISKNWKQETLSSHSDIRMVRNSSDCRYDEAYPVHETFAGKSVENMCLIDIFTLYQDRTKYRMSSAPRLRRDIQMLTAAPKNRRNLCFLGQTYSDPSIAEYQKAINSYRSALTYPTNLDGRYNFEINTECGKLAIQLFKSFEEISGYFDLAIQEQQYYIDPYIYLLEYLIRGVNIKLFALEKVKPKLLIYANGLMKCNKENIPPGVRVNDFFYDSMKRILLSCIVP